MNRIKIFGFAGSTYVRTARMMCIEKGIGYDLVPLEFKAESHRERHPFLKMPAMQHNDVHFFETLAIGVYVDSLRSAPPLQPTDVIARATMMQWISSAVDYLYPDLVSHLLGDSLPEGAANAVSRALDILDEALDNKAFLTGDSLTLADLFVAPMVDFAMNKDTRFALGQRTALQRWFDTMAARESFVSTAA